MNTSNFFTADYLVSENDSEFVKDSLRSSNPDIYDDATPGDDVSFFAEPDTNYYIEGYQFAMFDDRADAEAYERELKIEKEIEDYYKYTDELEALSPVSQDDDEDGVIAFQERKPRTDTRFKVEKKHARVLLTFLLLTLLITRWSLWNSQSVTLSHSHTS